LVKIYADAECADTRDKVFALLSFARECCRIAVPVDYTYSTYQLCNKLTRHHVQSHVHFGGRSSDLMEVVCQLNDIRRLLGEGSARERPKEGYPHVFKPEQYLAIFTDPHDAKTNTTRGNTLTVRGYLATTIREVSTSLKSIKVRKEEINVFPGGYHFYIQGRPLMNCLHTTPKDSMTNGQLTSEGQKNVLKLLAHEALFSIEVIARDTVGIAPPATRTDDKILIFDNERTTPKDDDIDKSTADVLAVVRSVNGKHEIVGRARLFIFPSDFFTLMHRKDNVEFEIDVPGVLLLSRATYNEPFLMMSEAWQDQSRNRSEFKDLKRMMEANSLLPELGVEYDVGGSDDLATYDGDYASGNEAVGKNSAKCNASGGHGVDNDIEAVDRKFLGLSLKPFVRRKWSRLKARVED